MLGSIEEVLGGLKETAARFPGSVAVASPGGYVTYKRFVANVERSVVELSQRGIRPGQLVVVAADNPDVTEALVLALIWIGCRIGYTREIPLYEAGSVSVDAVIVDRPATSARYSVIQVSPDWFKGSDPVSQLPSVANDCSIISSSSGSTGRPKLVEGGTKAVLNRLNVRKADFELMPRERLLSLQGDRVVGTLFESLFMHLTGGMVIRLRDRQPATVVATIQLYRPDYLMVGPAAVVDVLTTLDANRTKLDKVKMLRSTGAFFAPSLQEAALERIAEEVLSLYSCTEIGWVALGVSTDLRQVAGSVGRILPDVDVAAFDSDGRILAAGSEGEIRVKVADGCAGTYLQSGPAQHNLSNNGWFSTGDIGLVDEERNLIIRGRASNVINLGGDKVSPEELEECLLSGAEIVDVGVAGVPRAEGFEQIGAAIVAGRALTIGEINDHLRSHGVLWSVQLLRLVAAVPRTSTGKIDRPALKRLFVE